MKTDTYIQPKFYENIKLGEECSKPNENDLDWPGFTGFVAKIYQSQITRFLLGSNIKLNLLSV